MTKLSEDFREFVSATLDQRGARAVKIDAIVVEFEAYLTGAYPSVEVDGARVGIEMVEAYGLEITVDANGNAERITSLRGDFLID